LSSFPLEGSFYRSHNDRMKNKNKLSKKTQKLINNLQEMVNQPGVQTDYFKSWRESWMEVVEQLEKGYDYDRTYGAWPGEVIKP